jgi:DNA polymerase I-like protein with 3'-5' exonuclease and polymerase domains
MAYHKYTTIKKEKQLRRMIEGCKKTGYCSFDFETNAKNTADPEFQITLLGVCFQPGYSYMLPLFHTENTEQERNWEWFRLFTKEVLMDMDVVKVAYNLKYEMKCLFASNLDMKGRLFDAMLAKYLLNEERPNDLGSVVRTQLGQFNHYKDDTEQLAKKHGWASIPLKELSDRCALDADLTLRLMIDFEPKLIKNGFYNLFRNLLMPNTRVLAESEHRGLHVDVPYLKNLRAEYDKKLEQMLLGLQNVPQVLKYQRSKLIKSKKKLIETTQLEIEKLRAEGKSDSDRVIKSREEKISRYIAGEFITKKEREIMEPVNFGSPQQLKDLLFYSKRGFKFKVVKYTKDKFSKRDTDNASTDEEVLVELQKKDKSGFITRLLEHRGEMHLYNTYIKGTEEKLVGNKVHGNFLLHGTVTGRLCVGQKTLIKTNKGEIEIGELIPHFEGSLKLDKSLEALTHTGEYKPITHAINKGYEEMYEVELENGNTIECTLEHRFLTNKGWLSLKDILESNDSGVSISIWKS